MPPSDDTTRWLTDLGVSPGWNCLLVGPRDDDVASWVRNRVGPSGRVVVAESVPAEGSFDLVRVAGGVSEVRRLVDRLWFNGLLLLEDEAGDPAATAARLSAAGLEVLDIATTAAGCAVQARRPNLIVSF